MRMVYFPQALLCLVCINIHVFAVAVVSGMSNVTKANCDFDTDFCGYENPKFKYGSFFKTDFQWSRHKGDIKSGTGIVLSSSRPVGDHTSGNGKSRHFSQVNSKT